MAKKRRLKKPIRHALYRIVNVSRAVIVSSVIGYGASYALVPFNAATVSAKELTKQLAELQNKDLTDSKSLKETVIDAYQIKSGETVNADEATVLMTYPAVVTTPSFENAKFEVIVSKEAENTTETIEKSESDANTNTESDANSENGAIEATEETKQEETSNVSSETENASKSTETTENDTSNKADIENNVESSTETEKTAVSSKENSETSKTTIDLDEISKIDEVSVTTVDNTQDVSDKVDALSTSVALQSSAASNATEITLTDSEITVSLYTKIELSDYVKSISSKNNPYPIYKTDGVVNTSKEGTYEVTYTVIDTTGNSDSKTLTINVIKDDEQLEAERRDKVAKATQEFIDLTNGKAWDIDGAYGDQCWDLWAKYVVSEGLDFDYGCAPDGYADFVYKKYEKSGASKYFAKISKSEIQNGDWLFWDKGSSYPDSHVALLVKDYGDGTGLCLTQSRGNGTRLLTLNLDVLGGFRRIA